MFAGGEAVGGIGGAILRGMLPVSFGIYIQGPYSRAVSAAAAAAKKYQPFTRDSLKPEDLSPYVTVTASAGEPWFKMDTWHLAPPATHLVLIPRAKKADGSPADAVQPVRVDTFPMASGNALGAEFKSRGAIAYFEKEKIPSEDEIVVVTEGPETRIHVKKKQIATVIR